MVLVFQWFAIYLCRGTWSRTMRWSSLPLEWVLFRLSYPPFVFGSVRWLLGCRCFVSSVCLLFLLSQVHPISMLSRHWLIHNPYPTMSNHWWFLVLLKWKLFIFCVLRIHNLFYIYSYCYCCYHCWDSEEQWIGFREKWDSYAFQTISLFFLVNVSHINF